MEDTNVLPLHTNMMVAVRKKPTAVRPHLEKALKSGDPQRVIDCLTEKQRMFVEEYMKDLDATAAVIRSGYGGRNAGQMGQKLVRHIGVRAAIDALKAERAKNSDVTSDYVLREIVSIVESNKTRAPNTALRGLELLAKHLGMLKERTEISGPDGEAIQYQKVQEDADDFTRKLASLAARGGKTGLAVVPDTGTEG